MGTGASRRARTHHTRAVPGVCTAEQNTPPLGDTTRSFIDHDPGFLVAVCPSRRTRGGSSGNCCGLTDLVSFARGLEREGDALKAALTLSFSNGPTEGGVNRLKTIKRQMYGRAKFDLLRIRVLYG